MNDDINDTAEYYYSMYEQYEQLTKEQFLALQNVLDTYFEKDKYYDTKIYNLYYDNDNFDSIITSIEKPEYKSKVRLRCYGNSENVFLEVKQKFKGIVYKRRINLKTMFSRKLPKI